MSNSNWFLNLMIKNNHHETDPINSFYFFDNSDPINSSLSYLSKEHKGDLNS